MLYCEAELCLAASTFARGGILSENFCTQEYIAGHPMALSALVDAVESFLRGDFGSRRHQDSMKAEKAAEQAKKKRRKS